MWVGIGVLGMLLAGGCLVACLGLVGLGFALPAAAKARQAAQQAEANARQAAEAAAQQVAEGKARAADSPAANTEDGPLKEGTAEPEQDETHPRDGDRVDNE
jgi:hypothetical protein